MRSGSMASKIKDRIRRSSAVLLSVFLVVLFPLAVFAEVSNKGESLESHAGSVGIPVAGIRA